MRSTILEATSLAILITMMYSCAGQVAPSGGPPDTTSPTIVLSEPLPNSLNVSTNRIKLEFSKYVDRRSVEQSVFLSPPLGRPTFDWGGTNVEISFADSLRPNTTYILTLGTDVVDRRSPSNHLAESFALPFSTGSQLDSASIAGRIFDASPEGILVFAYRLDERLSDTLNPSVTKPDYLTQTGKTGDWKLTNLSTGSYRLIAVRDEARNLLYDLQRDEYGLLPGDITLSAPGELIKGVQFRMTGSDTTRPFLSSVRATDRTHFVLRFSEAMDSIDHNTVSIVDTVGNSPLTIRDVSVDPSQKTQAIVTTAIQDSAAVYRVTVGFAQDRFGNALNMLSASGIIAASTLRDTVRPLLEMKGIEDSSRLVQTDDTLAFTLTNGIKRSVFENGFQMLDGNKTMITVSFAWKGSMEVAIEPKIVLNPGTWYAVRIPGDSVRDFSGNTLRDSLWQRRFRMIDEKTTSSISGIVRDDFAGAKGRIAVQASAVDGKKIRVREVWVDSSGASFTFPHLPEGKYALSAFRDRDGNGKFSPGHPFPYLGAERFVIHPDTLKLRARWPLEGVLIKLK